MAFVEITPTNISNYINQFKDDFKRYEQKYENIEKDIVEFECRYQRDKYDLKDRFSNLNETLSIEILILSKINSFMVDKDIIIDELSFDFSNYSNILKRSEVIMKEIHSVKDAIEIIEENMLKNENKNDDKPNTTAVRSYLVQSRQTIEPFILALMQPSSRHLCNGCRENIALQHPYLRHREEYPSGTKILISHSYHIDRKCFCARGFQLKYLNNIKVKCEEDIDDNITKALLDIGFNETNILKKDDSDSDSDQSDAMSQCSGASQMPSQIIQFILRRRLMSQNKKIFCFGCREEIVPDTYLSFGHKWDQVLHVQKKCIQCVTSDFSHAKCKALKLLRSHAELLQLVSCGFTYHNIIGFKPQNPNNKTKLQSTQFRPVSLAKPSLKDVSFLFNNEPFSCTRLLFGERCQGCHEQVRKDDICLRHREQVPRDRLLESPLISQFYHCTKDCLIVRGFTVMFIKAIPCNIILTGQDNLKTVRNMVLKCGFSVDKLTFCTIHDQSHTDKITPAMGSTFNPFQSKRTRFVVDYSAANTGDCPACKLSLQLDKYVLKVIGANESSTEPVVMHLAANCVKQCGYLPEVLAHSDLTVPVPLSQLAHLRLEECGFRKLPRH